MLKTLIRRAFQAVAKQKKDEHIDNLAYLEGSVKYASIDIYNGEITEKEDNARVWQLLREYGQVAAEQERRDQLKYGR